MLLPSYLQLPELPASSGVGVERERDVSLVGGNSPSPRWTDGLAVYCHNTLLLEDRKMGSGGVRIGEGTALEETVGEGG